MTITPLILALNILLRSRFAELLAVFAPNAAGAEPYELSMCSRLAWLIFPRKLKRRTICWFHLARPLARTEVFQRFGGLVL